MEEDLEQAPPKKGVIHIGGHNKQEAPDIGEFRQEINSISARLRLIEEGFANLKRIVQITEENLITRSKYYNTEIKTITSDINDIRKELQELKEKMLLIIKELQLTAKREDVKVLEKYLNLWNPIKFVTYEQVESIVNDAMGKGKQ